MAWNNGGVDTFMSLLSDNPVYYSSEGTTIMGKEATIADLTKWGKISSYAVAGYPNDVIRIADDMIYYMGGFDGNYMSKSSGKSGSMKPGEFVTILRKINGNWVDEFTISFRRGRNQEPINIAKDLLHKALEGANTNSLDKLSEYLTDDVVQLNSSGEILIGKSNVKTSWEKLNKQFSNFHETGSVKDAIYLSDNAIFMTGSFNSTMNDKKTNEQTVNNGEVTALLVKDGNDWKYKRIVGMKRGDAAQKIMANIAGDLISSDAEALKIANQMATNSAFGYTLGTLDTDRMTKDAQFYRLDGETVTPGKATDEYYKKHFEQFSYALAVHTNEAFFVSKNIIFATGAWTVVSQEKTTGKYQDIQPGEFIYVLKNINGDWKILRSATFLRGKPANGNNLAASNN